MHLVHRRVALFSACAAAAGLLVSAAPAAPGKQELITRTLKRFSPRAITGGVSTAASTRRHRGRLTTVVLPTDVASLVDADGDGDVSTGDMVVASGPMLDTRGRQVGDWDGTFAHTSEASSMLNLTLRFPGVGTVTIAGAPYADGSPFLDADRNRFPAAPIVGTTGTVRYRGTAGFGVDAEDNLAVILPR